jgi:hypothetical protein
MYNADYHSQEFIEGMHDFIRVAEPNKKNGFMCYPCALCKNVKDYASSRTLHEHLFRSSFMPNYICQTKHRESGDIMEEHEEEEDDDNIRGFTEYGAFDDTAMGEAEEEVVAEDEPADDLGQAICNAQRDYKSEKEKNKLSTL